MEEENVDGRRDSSWSKKREKKLMWVGRKSKNNRRVIKDKEQNSKKEEVDKGKRTYIDSQTKVMKVREGTSDESGLAKD